ncbi:malto-oligosyltrehalose trehalohydrolase [Cellulomonas sp. HZM]|uniref:malto-oligosyltrehalose trehalohydrolase n=1 Tax=Cellulomonas sp. HZM TaxID=1454010 RepID=UPI0004934A4F|nr:malto-oligosyltrehalose trehalohydrolase [Cellulomonas sp. HZM]
MIPRVWAPDASSVTLVLGDSHVQMARDGAWWSGPELTHGTDYAFSVDEGPARPDPRSAWQPHGVHGPSRVFDPDVHVWRSTWGGIDVLGKVLYELHVGTFTPEGTLVAAADRLDELVHLGVDVVELMPLAPFDGDRGWGYDGVGPYGVHQAYGGPAALQHFVDTAHGLGLGVCLDVVHNHLGPSGNYLSTFGPYFTDRHRTPWGDAVNLDGPGSDEVRRWLIGSALRWFSDFRVDALRLDAVHELHDDSPVHVLAELSDAVASLSSDAGRPLSLVAETDLNDVVSITPTSAGGWGMSAQWADDVHHALHALLTGEQHGYYVDFGTPAALRTVMRGAFLHTGGWSTFRASDWGRPVPAGTDGHRFVVSDQNHDQVGNRATGDRPSAALDPDRLAASAALLLLSPFTPMLFMGEEWGATTPWAFFTSYESDELADAVRTGRAAEFSGHDWGAVTVPDPQARSTFSSSMLDRTEAGRRPHARMLEWYRSLVALRRAVPDLASGDLAATDLTWSGPDASNGPWEGVLVLSRGAARVLVRLGAGPEVTVALPSDAGALDVALAWGAYRVEPDRVALGGGAVVVLVPADGGDD